MQYPQSSNNFYEQAHNAIVDDHFFNISFRRRSFLKAPEAGSSRLQTPNVLCQTGCTEERLAQSLELSQISNDKQPKTGPPYGFFAPKTIPAKLVSLGFFSGQ